MSYVSGVLDEIEQSADALLSDELSLFEHVLPGTPQQDTSTPSDPVSPDVPNPGHSTGGILLAVLGAAGVVAGAVYVYSTFRGRRGVWRT